MATELGRRGLDLSQANASALALRQCPNIVTEIHREYLEAGADLLRCNSFALQQSWIDRDSALNLHKDQAEESVFELCEQSYRLAQQARREYLSHHPSSPAPPIVASLAPPRQSFSPLSAHSSQHPRNYYGPLSRKMLQLGCDAVLVETVTSLQLAVEALEDCGPACREFDRPLWLSVVTGPNGDFLGQGSFDELIQRLQHEPIIDSLLINCIDLQDLRPALNRLDLVSVRLPALTLGILPHLSGQIEGRWHCSAYSPESFAQTMSGLRQDFPQIQSWGACCGSTPQHIAALRQSFDRS